jgi:hypothetical protein
MGQIAVEGPPVKNPAGHRKLLKAPGGRVDPLHAGAAEDDALGDINQCLRQPGRCKHLLKLSRLGQKSAALHWTADLAFLIDEPDG